MSVLLNKKFGFGFPFIGARAAPSRFSQRLIRLRRTLCSLVLLVFSAGAQAGSDPKELAVLLNIARQKNPQIQAALEHSKAAKARISQAGAWEDPRASIQWMNIPVDNPSLSRTPMSGLEVGVKQKFPFPGKKGVARSGAKADWRAAQEEADDTRARVFWEIRTAYYDWYDVTRRMAILRQNQQIADQLVAVARKQFEANLVPQQDVLKAQVEYAGLTDQLLTLEQHQKSLQAKLIALIGEDADIQLAEALNVQAPALNKEKLLEEAKGDQHLLRARREAVAAAGKERAGAVLSYFSDVDVGFGYRFRNNTPGDAVGGEDFFNLSITVPLPLFAPFKQAKRVSETGALLRESEAIARSMEREIVFSLEDTLAEIERAGRQKNLIEGALLPQSRAALENSRSAYQSGQIEFLNVLSDWQKTLHFEMESVRAESAMAKAAARLAYLRGKEEML